jgi:tRNA-guanine family transglycosylase
LEDFQLGNPEEMYAMTEVVCEILPEDKPRYLMGVELNKYFKT